jgi:WHG domain-containing protein
LRISLHGFVALKMASAFGEPVDPEQTFERIVEQLTGLATK